MPKRSIPFPLRFDRLNFLQDVDWVTRTVTIALLLVSLGSMGWLALNFWDKHRSHRLILAAGSSKGESYILAKAIEAVVEKNVPRLELEVIESQGTKENIEWLQNRKADLVTAQADIPAGSDANTIAILYADSFQIVVQGKSTIQKFTDLKGKRVGLTRRGGQYESFLQVAQHFGLSEQDFIFIGQNDADIDQAFQSGKIDAVFRVRAIGNSQISKLIQAYGGRLIPIEQAEAMRLRYPAFEPNKIPRGAYQGKDPAVPAEELSTILVQRLLLTRSDLNPDLVQEITRIINENRRDLQAALPSNQQDVAPLVASIRRPDVTGGTGISIHGGALAYYDRDKPSFIQENADYVALILTVGLLMTSWIWELKRWVDRRRKNVADEYIESIVNVLQQYQKGIINLNTALDQIDEVFINVTQSLIREGISEESFRTFNEAYKSIRGAIDRLPAR